MVEKNIKERRKTETSATGLILVLISAKVTPDSPSLPSENMHFADVGRKAGTTGHLK